MSFDWIGTLAQAGAQDRATAANQQNAQATNTANLLLNILSRGGALTLQEAQQLGVPQLAGQSSAILPYYMSQIETSTGAASGQISQLIMNAGGTPAQQLLAAQNKVAALQPAENNALTLGTNLLSGEVTNQMLAEQQPVSQATLGVAETQKNAALEQLDATLNNIDALQAGKGYSGDSYGNRLLKFNARAGIMGQAAANIGLAKLANAKAVQGIQQTGRTMQLNNLSLPSEQAQNEIAMGQLPQGAIANTAANAQAPLSFFSIGNRPASVQNLPTVSYTSQLGLGLSGLGANVSNGINYGLNRQALSSLTSTGNSSGLGTGGGGLTPADMAAQDAQAYDASGALAAENAAYTQDLSAVP